MEIKSQSQFELPKFSSAIQKFVSASELLGKTISYQVFNKRLHAPGAFKPTIEEEKAINNFLNSFEAKKLRPHLTNLVMASQTLAVASLLATEQISQGSSLHLQNINLSHHDLELIIHAAFNIMFGSLAASKALLVADEKIKTYIPDILGFIVAAPLIKMRAPANVIESMIAFMDNLAYTDLIDKDKPLEEKKFLNTLISVMKSIPDNAMDLAQLKKT